MSERRDSGDLASDIDEEDGNDHHDHVAVLTGETSDPDRVVTPLQGDNNIDYFSQLPQDITSRIISCTSPGDASRLTLLSKKFYDAANSDAVWRHFLPAALPDGLPDDFHALQTQRERYLYLCNPPVLLDEGTRSFRLDMLSGAPIYFLSARALSITWGGSPQYWRWVAHQDSRFSTVAELLNVCWFYVSAEFNSENLSLSTFYEVYFVFKTTDGSYGLDRPIYKANLSVGNQESWQIVCLEPSIWESYQNVRLPQARMDGWMEMLLGEFYNDEDGMVVMKLVEIETSWKNGLIVEGVEIRPKPQ